MYSPAAAPTEHDGDANRTAGDKHCEQHDNDKIRRHSVITPISHFIPAGTIPIVTPPVKNWNDFLFV
jgi:hypothetical protein